VSEIDREAETLVGCPGCEACDVCGGAGELDCVACVLPHALMCTACKACCLCSGTKLVSATTRVSWLRAHRPDPPPEAA
jgi:hypothetical protein